MIDSIRACAEMYAPTRLGVALDAAHCAVRFPVVLAVFLAFMLCACAPLAQPASPPAAPAPVHRTHLPLVVVEGHTRACHALDTWAGSAVEQFATLGEGECGHVWWTPLPLPEGFWAACRSIAECEALDTRAIARARPGSTVLLLNEPNNSDVQGGGWPVEPQVAAQRLRPVIAALHAHGLKAACCGLYLDSTDWLNAEGWMADYRAAGGRLDLVHYHVFGRTADDARRIMRTAERLWPGRLIVSEAGWCEAVKDVVRQVDSPRYPAVFTLARQHCGGR